MSRAIDDAAMAMHLALLDLLNKERRMAKDRGLELSAEAIAADVALERFSDVLWKESGITVCENYSEEQLLACLEAVAN